MAGVATFVLLALSTPADHHAARERPEAPASFARLLPPAAIEQVVWKPLRRSQCTPPIRPCCPPATDMPATPSDSQPLTQPPQTPTTDSFASAGQGGTMSPMSYEPGLFGDLIGFSGSRVIDVCGDGCFVLVPGPSGSLSGGIKIADGESPRPTDRAFYYFNNFSYVNAYDPNMPITHLARHVLGFEKTLLQGNASVGMRLPFVNVYGNPFLAESQFSDMSIILKYALRNDLPQGNVFSGGVVFTVPTGHGTVLDLVPDPSNPGNFTRSVVFAAYFQPYVAYIRYLRPRLFLHGFSSLLTPSDGRLVTLLTNDVGLVLWLTRRYPEGIIRGVLPTVELHVNTPLDHRGVQSRPVGFTDTVVLTAGCSFLLQRALIGWAIATPLSGPRPFTIESLASVNFRF